jgi:hypothetical protein
MNERHFADETLDDQLRRFYQDVYEPIEPASQVWRKLESQLEVASPRRKDVLATLQHSSPISTMVETPLHSGGMRHRLGATVAVLLTGVIIAASLMLFHVFDVPSAGAPSVTHRVTSTANVPVTPVATVGPQQKYVYDIVTSNGVSSTYMPADQTSHFPAGSLVDVVCYVHGIPNVKWQKHTVSIHWYFDGQELQSPNGHISQVVDGPQVVYFALTYPEPGLGMAKVFFDLPSNDSGDQANDPYLAGQIYFAVDPASTPTPG